MSSAELPDWLSAEEMREISIDLTDRAIGDAGAFFLAQKLRGSTTVRDLWLTNCGIGAVGASALAASLGEHNSTVTYLDLGGNRCIGDDGAEALAQMLKNNTALVELYLGYCGIGDRGARALGEALKENTALKEFGIYSNVVTDDGAEVLAEALRWNESLTRLDLCNCQLTAAGASTLVAALRESNSTLTRLDLSGNKKIEKYQEITDSSETLLEENKAVVPASAERLARCLLFCCLRLAPT